MWFTKKSNKKEMNLAEVTDILSGLKIPIVPNGRHATALPRFPRWSPPARDDLI